VDKGDSLESVEFLPTKGSCAPAFGSLVLRKNMVKMRMSCCWWYY